MSWQIIPAHCLAHIVPSLSLGSSASGYPEVNLTTLDPNVLAIWANSGTVGEFRWDRGSTATVSAEEPTAIAFINHNFGDKAQQITLYSGATAGATTNTRYQATPANNKPIFATLSNNGTDRHYTLQSAGAAVAGFQCGVMTIGPYIDLGNPQLGGTLGGSNVSQPPNPGPLGRTTYTGSTLGELVVSKTFRAVTTANAKLLAQYWRSRYLFKSGNDGSAWAVGGGAGRIPAALKDNDGNVYYGPAQITFNEWGAGYHEVTITLTDMAYPAPYLLS